MHFVRVISVAAICICSAFSVTSAKAGFETDHVEISVPTSAWLVGPAMIAANKAGPSNIPCIMVNQFNTGEAVRISGGGGQIYAIAINFGRRLFSKAQDYTLDLSIDPNYQSTITAMAYDAETLLLSMKEEAGFYKALEGGKTLYLNYGDDTFDLLLSGAKQGLQRLEECYSDSIKQATGVQNSLIENAEQNPSGFMPMPEEAAKLEHKSKTPDVSVEAHQRQVESLVDDLMQVAESSAKPGGEERTQPVKQIKSGPMMVTGGKMASTWATPNMPVPPRPVMAPDRVPNHMASVPSGQQRTWRAIRGSSLREIIDVWAQQENVRVVWMAGESYSVKETMRIQGRFEDAILSILSEYEDESPRPVGKIYKDPQFNQRVLLVESKEDY